MLMNREKRVKLNPWRLPQNRNLRKRQAVKDARGRLDRSAHRDRGIADCGEEKKYRKWAIKKRKKLTNRGDSSGAQ